MKDTRTARFHGATEAELQAAGATWRALLDARQRFPHHGQLRLTADFLELGDWLRLSRREVQRVERGFTAAYPRWLAGGIRGQGPSLGFFTRGEPLVLHTAHGRLYLLIDYHWLTGFNEGRRWQKALEDWLQGQPEERAA